MPPVRSKKRSSSTLDTDVRDVKKIKIEEPNDPPSVSNKLQELKNDVTKKEECQGDGKNNYMSLQDNICAYERKRLQNLKENAEFFSSLGIEEAKFSLHKASGKAKQKNEKAFQIKKEKPPPGPRRTSLRLKRIDPEGVPLPTYFNVDVAVHERPKRPSGPLDMADIMTGRLTVEDNTRLLHSLKGLQKRKSKVKINKTPLTKYITEFGKISLREDKVKKIVPDRIFSLAIHPMSEKILVAAGGKWGAVGLWDSTCEADKDYDGVLAYTPHSRPVICTEFSPFNWSQMLTCSYDCTMRLCDLERGVFDEVYSIPEDDNNLLKYFDFMSAYTMLVSQQDGNVALVDTRTNHLSPEQEYFLHEKSLRSVSINPVDKNYFVTASTDQTARLWDIRKLHSKAKKNHCLDALYHGKMVDSAFFSPITGNYLLTTSMDDSVSVTEISDGKFKKSKRIRHDNHVGRWLTKFRATWHPSREDMFVIGSMNRPRQIEVYGIDGSLLRSVQDLDNLGSVCSLNVIHPTRNVLIGANGSGRVHIFK